jgi:ribosomal protein S18 acetylase RimI-like enzyme
LFEVSIISIRPAHKTDAITAAALIQQASVGISSILTGSEHEPEILAILAHFFQAEDNRLSYRNALVAEEEQQVVGIIVTYYGRDAANLDRPIIEHLQHLVHNASVGLDKEADDDEFYIDTLSVSPDYAGRGIGTALLQAAEQRARQLQHKKLSLNVDEENERAYNLYKRLGYQTEKIVYLYGHPYQHMLKRI